MREVHLNPRSPDELGDLLPRERMAALVDVAAVQLRERLAGRSVINVNSTAVGGGVAEMLRWMLPYGRGAGVDTRWFVIEGDPELFTITKRIHHRLHGSPGDGGPLGPAEAEHLRAVGRANADELASAVVPGDVLLVHDPQPVGLVPACASWGAPIVWRCHIGTQQANEHSTQAWEFLRPFLDDHVDVFVFTNAAYAPDWVSADRLAVIRPSIDPLSPKNLDITTDQAIDVLRHVGIVAGLPTSGVTFRRADRTPGRVLRFADIIRTGPAPGPEDPLVVQVSRWDPLKDMPGVMHAFTEHVLDGTDAHLVLAGPVVTSVADDPSAAVELENTWSQWRQLPHAARSRVQLVCLPMTDPDENATIVNALQRHASVVTQKSLAEGFGLTVTEAMFKRCAVVASRVGGIADQITDGLDGRLVDDPTDLADFGDAVGTLLSEPGLRTRLGEQARETVIARFLPDTALNEWGAVIEAAVVRHAKRPRRAP